MKFSNQIKLSPCQTHHSLMSKETFSIDRRARQTAAILFCSHRNRGPRLFYLKASLCIKSITLLKSKTVTASPEPLKCTAPAALNLASACLGPAGDEKASSHWVIYWPRLCHPEPPKPPFHMTITNAQSRLPHTKQGPEGKFPINRDPGSTT